MKLKFWQKTYCAILTLFFLCLYSVVFATYRVAYQQSYDTYLEEQLGTQHYILENLAKDMVSLSQRRPDAMGALYQYYATQYAPEQLYFEVYQAGTLVFDATPIAYLATGERPECAVASTYRTYLVRTTTAGRRLFSATGLADSLDDIVIVWNAEIESFYREWEEMARLFLVATSAVSVLFSTILYVALSRLYRPLAVVTQTANALASGALTARAQVTRKDEFGTLAQSMNGMAQTLETQICTLQQATEEKQQLLDHLAHEIRTPLASISGWAETMRGAALDEQEQAEAIETILFESNRILSLSKQLLSLSALRHDTACFVPVPLDELCARAAHLLQPKAVQKSICILQKQAMRCPEQTKDAWSVQGDETLLESLLINLMDNAIKACTENDTVTLTLCQSVTGALQLIIADTGRGMQAETLQQIGTPFYREDKARSRSEGGAGLGVSLCLAIAQYHGATLQYQSEVGTGTTCTVTFATSTQV